MNSRIRPTVLFLACASFAAAGAASCESGAAGAAPEPSEPQAQPVVGEGEADEPSDLDRSVAELMNLTCEHGMPTYECSECRYEVGFSKEPAPVASQPGATAATPLIQSSAIIERTPQASLALTGEVALAGDRTVHIGPRSGGTVRSVLVDLGSRVAAGDVLLEIDSREVAEAKSRYLARLSVRSLAARTLSRERALSRQGISAGQERWAAQAALEQAEIELRVAREDLVILGIPEEQVEVLEGSGLGIDAGVVAVRASLPGTVVSRHAVLGETVEVGEDLLVISDLSVVWVWADVRGIDIARVLSLPPGSRPTVTVTTSGLPGVEFTGTVDYASGEVDETTRTLRVRATVPNPSERLRPGMFVGVTMDGALGPSVSAVPAVAVLSDEGRDFVFVRLEDDFYVRRPVTVARRVEGWAEMLSGPAVGTVVATEGAFLLKSDVLRSKMGAGCAD